MSSSEAVVSRRLEGKVAIVTGGASGIGATTVSLFHRHGAKVVIADIQDNLGQTLADNLGGDVLYVHCDVTNEEHVSALVETAVARFGQLDIMYGNAGIFSEDMLGSIRDIDKKAVERTLGVNLVGNMLVAKHAARAMVPAMKGCIIFTASSCTVTAGAEHGYMASKCGLVGLTKNLAVELGAHGIRVNCISPFGVLTGNYVNDEVMKKEFESWMSKIGVLKGYILNPGDIASAALYLGSDESRYVNGINLVVDGGYSVVNPTVSNLQRGGGGGGAAAAPP